MLQAVNGLRTYAELRRRRRRRSELFEAGDRSRAGADRAAYDTGAWSLYSRPAGQPGPGGEPQLPHAQPRLRAQPVQGAPRRPGLLQRRRPLHAVPEGGPDARPARAPCPRPATRGQGRAVPLQALEGRARRDRRAAPTAARRTSPPARSFAHGERYFRWVPPRLSDERTYDLHALCARPRGQLVLGDRARCG